MRASGQIDDMRRASSRREGYADGLIVGRWQTVEDGGGSFMGVPFKVTVEWPEGEPSEHLMQQARRIIRDMERRNS